MDNQPFVSHDVKHGSYVSFLKREIHNTAVEASYSVPRIGVIDIIVAELTSNLLKHASDGGELLYRFSKENGVGLFEVICLDNGPGMDVPHSMQDGVTTTKTLGHGLGALKRLSGSFHVYSLLKWGTICYSKVYSDPNAVSSVDTTEIRVRALNVSKPGQEVSGDGFDVKFNKDHTNIFVGDGLGHGKDAHLAVQAAVTNFRICPGSDPAGILQFIHGLVKKTRGLVATAVTIDHQLKKWKICGIGNVATRICEGLVSKNYSNYNGIIGLRIPGRFQNHEAVFSKHQCLVMTTDGIGTHWALSQFPYILRHDPIMLAVAIYKQCARKTDDRSILVART